MSYSPGDTVVHPQHGTATVEGLVSKDVGSGPEDYLELYVDNCSLRILVPANAVAASGIRDLSTTQQAQAILEILAAPSEVAERWAERNASTQERIRSHDLGQVSMVVRDLVRYQQRRSKPLSQGERDKLEACLGIVARELSLVLDRSEQDIRDLIVETCLSAAPSAEGARP